MPAANSTKAHIKVGQSVVVIYGIDENRGIRLEGHGCAGGIAGADDLQLGGRLSAGIFLHVHVAVAPHLGTQIVREYRWKWP